MAIYWLGTSGYASPHWRGSLYPQEIPDDRLLAAYAESFPSVELGSASHKLPNARTVQGWGKQTPADFRFSFRAPRIITHDLRLRDAGEPAVAFLEAVSVLGEKLGAILFQLPQHLRRDLPRLEDFLHQLPEGLRIAFEFRNRSWFHDEVYACLQRFDAALCATDAAAEAAPVEPTASFGYVRFCRPEYAAAELDLRVGRVREIRSWRDVFIYVDREDAGAPELVQRLRAALVSPPVAASPS